MPPRKLPPSPIVAPPPPPQCISLFHLGGCSVTCHTTERAPAWRMRREHSPAIFLRGSGGERKFLGAPVPSVFEWIKWRRSPRLTKVSPLPILMRLLCCQACQDSIFLGFSLSLWFLLWGAAPVLGGPGRLFRASGAGHCPT